MEAVGGGPSGVDLCRLLVVIPPVGLSRVGMPSTDPKRGEWSSERGGKKKKERTKERKKSSAQRDEEVSTTADEEVRWSRAEERWESVDIGEEVAIHGVRGSVARRLSVVDWRSLHSFIQLLVDNNTCTTAAPLVPGQAAIVYAVSPL